MRTKSQVQVLCGHEDTVASLLTHTADPQVVTGSHDSTVKLWDLAKAQAISTLTQHKKSVRSLVASKKVGYVICSMTCPPARLPLLCLS